MTQSLIERLEKLTGPDREVDGLIGLLINPGSSLWTPEWWSGGPNEYLRWPDPTPGVARYEMLRHYTSSIDAALTLFVEPETHVAAIKIERDPQQFGDNWHVAFRHQYFGHAKTAATATAACALRARAALEDKERG